MFTTQRGYLKLQYSLGGTVALFFLGIFLGGLPISLLLTVPYVIFVMLFNKIVMAKRIGGTVENVMDKLSTKDK